MIQELVEAGHPWSSIKGYTLGEIGMFITAIRKRTIENRINLLSLNWMASNASQKDLKRALSEMSRALIPKEQKTSAIKEQWRGLAKALSFFKR